jgi:hypothetical protein
MSVSSLKYNFDSNEPPLFDSYKRKAPDSESNYSYGRADLIEQSECRNLNRAFQDSINEMYQLASEKKMTKAAPKKYVPLRHRDENGEDARGRIGQLSKRVMTYNPIQELKKTQATVPAPIKPNFALIKKTADRLHADGQLPLCK